MKRLVGQSALLLTILCMLSPGSASYLGRAEVDTFVAELARRHSFDEYELRDLFRGVRTQQRVLEAIARPAEAKPWHAYRPIFVTDSRIRQGTEFWNEHAALLSEIESDLGVPAEILVAIVGVETRYGRHRGSFRALDTLTTLAFDYPPRSAFFRRELEQFLLLVRDEGLDARRVSGSYAAAMGMPQFISSSYREYAVDYDKDGRRDLWDSPEDVLASVANYFRRHGWRRGDPVTFAVTPDGTDYRDLLRKELQPRVTLEQLRSHRLIGAGQSPAGPFTVMELQGTSGPEVWVGHYNFYVITRYNHSRLYAMAVHQLSRAVRERRAQPQVQITTQ
ncbi:MAG: lytic murein transglycosylase B [Gammaproteobacteria bacterium]|nr:lytic murein transglycosylase B [Gammaproteobacteria bacterium]